MGSSDYVIGVDVGTGSVRAALVSAAGTMVKSAVKEIKTWNPKPNFHQQSSEDIWNAVCATVKVSHSSLFFFESKQTPIAILI